MASCEEMRTRLDRYVDDELGREERLDFESHLGDCPECSRELGERRAAMGMLADWSASLKARPAPRRAARSRLPLVLAAAAALLLVAVPVGLYLRGEGTQTKPVIKASSGRLTWRTMDEGVEIVRGKPGEAMELVVDPFPATLRKLTPADGVEIVNGKSGSPDELVVDPFPEEGK